jgi:hypothetical protein
MAAAVTLFPNLPYRIHRGASDGYDQVDLAV